MCLILWHHSIHWILQELLFSHLKQVYFSVYSLSSSLLQIHLYQSNCVGAALICSFFLSKPMEAYQLGEASAASMGVRIRRFRTGLILLSSVLSASVTAFAGPISFVGIAVPQLMKSLFRTAKPLVMVPACFLGGAGFCLLCDLIARTVFAPTELSISSVTAIFGAPVVIRMLLKRGKGAVA